ncbi:thioredoxin-disulfide reductase [Candidatus Woesebacteria bacterium RIFCSPLOWO2_01_FULL_39_23]|uniref:Thioredoxin reductase n=1 Tax=Candidatus Woesebacteria bacterium RIFCSPHIGHO2_01_FULL_40_22 TaxID=1802499 RepID=A0A1F7YIK1_9BACT|nr:MAG: thioredoxin-disulfide reductase [Candidatus Woesebacteria bacterium RBG_16_40_11]OGM27184.1 MAG: thioredoxin-disulfide reductase [Candidatus Woesebacteria bacterium RIFCSPHIGHO2_01_FULL_40_22]OGM36920.1 MAG: thioredoxin-disulfide reductase [Candidatus Woesebacteria bacterium RIFCSPHIGHO2_12_FULL_38_9]OGM63350.1 MAG: thioredoxin-disulfide reductase [Candidatus Woesebacteria bacterium RIFCSPLOWO2_01_FULL_39_23]
MNDIINFASKPREGDPWEVAIIGSGPASFTAAIYTTRGAASTLILGGEKWGGQLMLTTTVDNFPGFPEGVQGPDLMQKMKAQAERFGAEFVAKNVEAVDFDKKPFEILAGGVKYLAKSIIIATGADTKWLGVPGEKELIGRGVSSCAPCDAPFFKGKRVAVVGGGDSAMEEALTLTKYTDDVTIIHRRDEFRASVAMQKRVTENSKIKILWNTEVTEIIGKDRVEKLILKNNKDGSSSELPVDGVFVAVGHVPSTQVFAGKIEMDEKGYVVVKDSAAVNTHEGVFVAGDVHDWHYGQAVTAAGFGCMAGIEALRFLDKPAPSW